MGCLSNPTVNRPFHALLDLLDQQGGLPVGPSFASGQGFVSGRRKWQPPRRLSSKEVARLVARYEVGAKVRELASEFGVHKHTVSAHLVRQGVPTRIGGRVVDEAAALEILRFYTNGQTMDEIAAEIRRGAVDGVASAQTSERWLSRAGLAAPSDRPLGAPTRPATKDLRSVKRPQRKGVERGLH